MRLILTGGGTGGHIYPALEVGRLASEHGADLVYLGSLRGQEGDACKKKGIEFHGFPSAPLYSLRERRGWQSLVGLLRSVGMARRQLVKLNPDVLFSTGGYSAAPVVKAAQALGIPFVIHEANSVPGRTNLMFASKAYAFTCIFHNTVTKYSKGAKATRTGQPIRKELRDVAKDRIDEGPFVLVVGGSQGSEFLNNLVPQAQPQGVRVLHAVGRNNFRRSSNKVMPRNYDAVPYLDTTQLVDAYRRATVVVARSGSSVAEFAMFGLPSVLIPLPTAADNHQYHNAEEFAEMGAATLLPQDEATPAALQSAILEWLDSPDKRQSAQQKLHDWDVPDATDQIVRLVEKAAAKKE